MSAKVFERATDQLNYDASSFLDFLFPVGSVVYLFQSGEVSTNHVAYTRMGTPGLDELLVDLDGPGTVYYSLNPASPECLNRAPSGFLLSRSALSLRDEDVSRRSLLLIDIDPQRPAKMSATDEERQIARQMAGNILCDLESRGWPQPVIVDSGNGYHLLYRIDLPADDGGLVKACLHALAQKHNVTGADVDTKVFNRSRIAKLPGTWARKGPHTDDRPHRRAGFFPLPKSFEVVQLQHLQQLAGPPFTDPVKKTRSRPCPEYTAEQWMQQRKKLAKHVHAQHCSEDKRKTLANILLKLKCVSPSGEGWTARCPSHNDGTPSLKVDIKTDGTILFKCFAGCEFEVIVDALGLYVSDMFADSEPAVITGVALAEDEEEEEVEELTVNPQWEELSRKFRQGNIRPNLTALAKALKVSLQALDRLDVGWNPHLGCWTFPERNGKGQVVGILQRFQDGRKLLMKGGRRGLVLPRDWQESADSPLWICEGATDVAAALTYQCRAIGRPSMLSRNSKLFAELLSVVSQAGGEVCVVADNDPTGRGHHEADALAQRLADALSISVETLAPPQEFKDLREFFFSGECVMIAKISELEKIGTATPRTSPKVSPRIRPVLANTRPVGKANSRKSRTAKKTENIPPAEILRTIVVHTNGWPRCVAGTVVMLREQELVPVVSEKQLFAQLYDAFDIQWSPAHSALSKGEFFHYVRTHAEQFRDSSQFPHFPPIEGVLYVPRPAIEAHGTALEEFVEFFTPATHIDRHLITAFLMTLFWGGEAGQRPAFLIETNDTSANGGKGWGKTTLVQMAGALCGGHMSTSPNEPIKELKRRILNPGQGVEHPRVVLFDNIRAKKLDSSDLESLVTESRISAHALYRGDLVVPNFMTVVLTSNGLVTQSDLAERIVTIRLGQPQHSGEWLDGIRTFVKEREQEIVADIGHLLTGENSDPSFNPSSRWSHWEKAVLAKLENPKAIADAIIKRRLGINSNSQDAEALLEFLQGREHFSMPSHSKVVKIKNDTLYNWLKEFDPNRRLSLNTMTRWLESLGTSWLRSKRNNGRARIWYFHTEGKPVPKSQMQ